MAHKSPDPKQNKRTHAFDLLQDSCGKMFSSSLRQLASRMTDPIRRLRLVDSNSTTVLPFCYELALRQPRTLSTINAVANQSGAASSSRPKEQNIEDNPYYSKYAEKIKKAQIEKGNKSTPTFAEDLKASSEEKAAPVDKVACQQDEAATKSELKDPKIKEDVAAKPNPALKKFKRNLDDVVKVEKLMEKSADEITQIWNAYHRNKDGVYATIPADLYHTLYKNSVNYPAFILPLPRKKEQSSEGYEFFLLQFQEHSCYFTPLAAYHLHKEIAPICLTLNHYPELSQSKGLVLLNSEYDSNILNIMECQCLANQLQYYYTTQEAAPKLSLHLFNKEPKSFDHLRLIRHLEEGMLSNGLGGINLDKQD